MTHIKDFKLVWYNHTNNFSIHSIDSPLVKGKWVVMKRKFYEL